MKSNKSENAKNKNFKLPMDMPHVEPQDYDASIGSARGSAHTPEDQAVTPGHRKNPAKEKQKERGQLPLHDEPIGGG